MKAIYLNIWAGKVFEPLIAYIRAAAADTDFFCLQEVFDSPLARTVSWSGRADIFTHLKNALPEFTPFFSLTVENFDGDRQTDFPMLHGNVIFARKEIPILSHSGMLYTIASVHGTAFPGSKADTPERIAQSQKIADFLADEKGRKILGGDFNLMPDTESVSMIERTGMRNLIKEYGITDTRGRLSHAQYTESQRQYFADFAFTSPDVLVKNFAVPQVEISDHLPLVVEWT